MFARNREFPSVQSRFSTRPLDYATRPLALTIAIVFAGQCIAQPGQLAAQETANEQPSNSGQADLDEAVLKRIEADTAPQLEAVAALLESAIEKGLDAENDSFAKQMLGSVLLQRSQGLFAAMIQVRGRRQLDLRDQALEGLERAIEFDPELVEAHLLIARLNVFSGGDRQAVTEATTRAIELLEDDPIEQSSAYLLRSISRETNEERMADLNAAIESDPNNLKARQARADLRLAENDVEGAIMDFETVLEREPTNVQVAQSLVRKLRELGRAQDAVDRVTKSINTEPSEGLYRLRAGLYQELEEFDKAREDLDAAVNLQPRDPLTLLQRAELGLNRGDVLAAKEDLNSALRIAPQLERADVTIALRSYIALNENRMADAINFTKMLVERNPDDIERKKRLATLYTIDQRPRKAIDVFTGILENDSKNVDILRSRGDALLSVGDHSSAIDDYETAISALGNIEMVDATEEQKTSAAGIYNNLSWVLATSPIDSVRDGKRALELGETAAKLTDFAEPHILSTLAAAYAESGDFDNARKWSGKAVELGRESDHDQLDQLEMELESYKQNKPWREKQETEENAVPILSPEDLIDT